MQQPPKKRLRVDTGRDALDSDNDDNINDRRSAPKQRISHACDRCRSRRAKCDGSQPTCVTCAAANVTCTYGTHTKKRGLPTGYVRMLELLWALVFATIPGAEDATLQLLRSASVVAGDAGVALLYNAKDPMRDRDELLTQDFWARSKVREALDARVLKIDAAGGRGSESESRHRVIWEGIPLPTDLGIEPWTAMPCTTQNYKSTTCPCSSMTGDISPTSAQVELPDDAWAQTGVYLNYSYCWLPVVPKHDIVRLLSRRQDGSSCTAAETALLWSILAVSSSLKTDPDLDLMAVYHSAAMKELEKDNEKPSAHHAAAVLLLGLTKMELHQWKDAYLLIGRAVRLVHYMYNTTSQPDLTLNRVYLGTFILDTLLSSYLGIAAFLSPQHMMPALSAYESDGPEEWDAGSWDLSGSGTIQCPVRAMSIFGQLARLMMVLNKAIAPGSQPVSAVDTLSEWLGQLPRHCSPKGRTGSLTPPLVNLDMIYWVVKAYISGSTHGEPHVSVSPSAEYIRIFGTHASKSMLHICQNLSATAPHGSGYVRDNQLTSVARDGATADASILPNLSFVEQAPFGVRDVQYSIDDSVNYIPGPLQEQSLARSRRSSTSGFAANASEQPYPRFNGTLFEEPDDTEAMQAMLDGILAQEAGNGSCFSNFMQDLGFFDENMPPQGSSM